MLYKSDDSTVVEKRPCHEGNQLSYGDSREPPCSRRKADWLEDLPV